MSPAHQSLETTNLAGRTRRKIRRRLIPFFLLLYTIAFLDRVNLSYVSLEMTKDLHFSNSVYGLGAGIFFLGYWLLEIPGAIIVERWSASKWICRIMITWGVAAGLTGLIHTQSQFYWARFLLGVAEAGFFPGMAVYITHWFRAEDRAKALAGLLVGYPVAQIVGAPLSAAFMSLHWLGLAGWRWLLIWEGVPAILVGIWVLFYLTDRPADAKWLTAEERDWIAGELRREKRTASATQVGPWRVALEPRVLLLTAIWFLSTGASNTFALWLPKFVQGMSGYSSIATTLASTVPFLAALPFTLLAGWNSDRTGERRWHTAGCLFLAAAGLVFSRLTNNVPLGIAALTIAAMHQRAASPVLVGVQFTAVGDFVGCGHSADQFVWPAEQLRWTVRCGFPYRYHGHVRGWHLLSDRLLHLRRPAHVSSEVAGETCQFMNWRI